MQLASRSGVAVRPSPLPGPKRRGLNNSGPAQMALTELTNVQQTGPLQMQQQQMAHAVAAQAGIGSRMGIAADVASEGLKKRGAATLSSSAAEAPPAKEARIG